MTENERRITVDCLCGANEVRFENKSKGKIDGVRHFKVRAFCYHCLRVTKWGKDRQQAIEEWHNYMTEITAQLRDADKPAGGEG